MAIYYVSSETQLVNEVNSAASGDTIALENNIELSGTLNIPANKSIILTSAPGNNFSLMMPTAVTTTNTPIIRVSSNGAELTLSDITIDGQGIPRRSPLILVDQTAEHQRSTAVLNTNDNTLITNGNDTNSAGGIMNYGTVNMNGGAITNNRSPAYGGGIINNIGLLNMNGGKISNNYAADVGGGIFTGYGADTYIKGGEISNNSAGNGGGGMANDGDLYMSGGDVINNTAPQGGGVFNYDTFYMSGGNISDNTAEEQGGGLYNFAYTNFSGGNISGNEAPQGGGVYNEWTFSMNGGYVSKNSATNGGGIYSEGYLPINSGTINGNTAAKNGGGVYATALKDLYVESPAVFLNNYAGNGAYTRNSADDAMYSSHIKGTRWTNPLTQGYNNYDINYTNGTKIIYPVDVFITGGKTAEGAPLTGEEFEFGLYGENNSLLATTTNGEDGSIAFPALTISAAGTTSYTVRELTQSGGGWTTDSTVYPVTVTAGDNGTGQLVAAVSYPKGAPVFVNTHALAPADISLSAVKTATGAPLTVGQFEFGLYDEDNNLIATATNDEGETDGEGETEE